MVNEFLEEGFGLVHTVECLGLFPRDIVQPYLFESEAFPFQSGENIACDP